MDLDDGRSLREIAEDLGMVYETLRVWLLSEVPEQYREAQTQGLLKRIADADEDLETASSHVGVARADRVCKYARWDAERRRPTMFAQRHEITGANGTPLIPEMSNLERARRLAFVQEQVRRNAIDTTYTVVSSSAST